MEEQCEKCGQTVEYLKINSTILEEYHEARMKELTEITDEEIETKASDVADPSSKKDFSRGEWLGFKEGAKWYRSEHKKRMT